MTLTTFTSADGRISPHSFTVYDGSHLRVMLVMQEFSGLVQSRTHRVQVVIKYLFCALDNDYSILSGLQCESEKEYHTFVAISPEKSLCWSTNGTIKWLYPAAQADPPRKFKGSAD
jgi:hypothetical protein